MSAVEYSDQEGAQLFKVENQVFAFQVDKAIKAIENNREVGAAFLLIGQDCC